MSSSSSGSANALDASAGTAIDAASADAVANSCPAPPATEPAQAIKAANDVNATRALAGIPCITLVPALDTSAQRHCDYYAGNFNAAPPCKTMPSNAHSETANCAGFVAANFGARETMAGYTITRSASEVMAFTGNPDRAVQTWIDSVYHRIPMLSPWTRDMGYGGTTTPTGCDTIDFGSGASTPGTVTAIYPYSGQTGVPTSFDGRNEGPMPPAPASGWPSGYPITLYLQGGAVQTHQITIDGNAAPIAHVWLDPTSPNNGQDDYFLYTDTPLMTNTTYHVQIAATRGATSLSFDWKFTTGAR